ncbi:MAG: hypothetical protein F9K13_07015 [Candidatus Methylomirabilis oxygeniifera]|uniref:KANL3/Tex30 alpha/beta hydrolase-like domain-containing protein n=1 Tax=Methylomirabilis oxygeniifera TaxID=671143 RepID=D5MH55_METO1|nr:MAG: hypothetical protein F9K13_07015 [Candidatus Methylomirabilis oxyfera]CBE69086.1 protein of unknown function [Candidatus Methylomirabilis oxyfera]
MSNESSAVAGDEPIQILVEDKGSLAGKLRRTTVGRKWALICRGLTGSLECRSSLDDLADSLDVEFWSSLRFDYRHSLKPEVGESLRTAVSMVADTKAAMAALHRQSRRMPDVVIARGYGARIAMEALLEAPDVPLIMWAPIIWLRTSLEIRYRLHEIRRLGFTEFDNAKVDAQFIASLQDPSDEEIKSWIVPTRQHVIICAQDDSVVPERLIEETEKVITSAGARVVVISVPGEHPHPDKDVSRQISKIIQVAGILT